MADKLEAYKSQPSVKTVGKEQQPSSKSDKISIRQLIIDSGFHWDVDRRPAAKGPRGEQNPELIKFKELLEQAHLNDSRSKNMFWTLDKRRNVREVSVRVFTAGLIACVVLALIAFFWYYHFNHVYNLYVIPVAVHPKTPKDNSSSEEPAHKAHIETPFILGVKDAECAFDLYAFGLLFLVVGSVCAGYARKRSFKYRVWFYLGAIILNVGAIICFVMAPIIPLFASNDDKERAMLETDEIDGEFKAYQRDIKGSLEFFRKGQCENSEASTDGKDEDTKIRMIFFCDMISRLTYFFYFMWASIVVPLLILVLCLLEILANARSWKMKAKCDYKKRTAQQIEADKSTSLQKIKHTNIDLLY